MNMENEEYDERIKKYRLEDNFGPGVIANRLHVEKEFIQFRLRRLGLRYRYRIKIENPEAIRETIRANPDLTYNAIAEKMGLTYENVRWQARQMGVSRKNKSIPIDDNVLIDEYCGKLRGAVEVAKNHGYGLSKVYGRLKELGVYRGRSERYQTREGRKSRETGLAYPSCGNYPLVKIPEGHITRSRCMRSGFAFAHIIAMEQKLGRPLTVNEKVHHIDFDKSNPSIDNLHLCQSNAEHSQIHCSLEKVCSKLFTKGLIEFAGDRYVVNWEKVKEYLASIEPSMIPDPIPKFPDDPKDEP